MSKLLTDKIENYSVIIASGRDSRPNDHKEKNKSCPFCPGNENQTPPETLKIEKNGKWLIRAFPNKYPAISFNKEKKYSLGEQEVIVESPDHFTPIEESSDEQIINLLNGYINRLSEKSKNYKYILIFKNCGEQAGASLVHPHSQLYALKKIPNKIKEKHKRLRKYKQQTGTCYYCALREKGFVFFENDNFYAVIKPTENYPFAFYIIPKKHQPFIEQISPNAKMSLVHILKKCLKTLKKIKNDIAYNLILQNCVYSEKYKNHFHWHIHIIPRVDYNAGFELATGLSINTMEPKQSAQLFKKNIS